MKLSYEVHIAAPPGRVYQALADLGAARHWMQGLISIERLEGDGGPGTQWRGTRRIMGHEGTVVFEVASARPGERLSLRVDGSRGSNGQGEHVFDYRLEPKDGGTRLMLDAQIELKGMAKLMEPVIAGALGKTIESDLEALKAYVETGVTA